MRTRYLIDFVDAELNPLYTKFMIPITIRLERTEYKLLADMADAQGLSLAAITRQIIKKGLIRDINHKVKRVQAVSIIESLLILRSLATTQDETIVEEANIQARKLIDKLFAGIV